MTDIVESLDNLVSVEIQTEFIDVSEQGAPGIPGPVGSGSYTGGPTINSPLAPGDSLNDSLNKLQGQTNDRLPLEGGAMGGRIDMGNNDLQGIKTAGFEAEYNCGLTGAALTIFLTSGQKQKVTLSAPAPAITIEAASASVGHYQIRILQDISGARVPSFIGLSPNRWLGSSTAPAINAAANGESILNLYWDGVNLTQSLVKVGAA